MQGALIPFEREDVVATAADNFSGEVFLAPHGVDGDGGVVEVEQVEDDITRLPDENPQESITNKLPEPPVIVHFSEESSELQ